MKKQAYKEILRSFPIILALIASMASVASLLSMINFSKSFPFEIMLGISGSMIGACVVYLFAKIQRALNAPKVFISYANKDSEIVLKICASLSHLPIEILLDQHELRVGDNINEKLSDLVESCDYFVWVNSKASFESTWAKKELEKAIKQRKKILPIQIDQSKIPDQIHGIFYADFTATFENGVKQMENALKNVRHNKANSADAKRRAAD